MILLSKIDWDDITHLGGEYLDDVRPGWFRELDSDLLDISMSGRCVLGQLYGSFHTGMDSLGLNFTSSAALGFFFNTEHHAAECVRQRAEASDQIDVRYAVGRAMYAELTASWKQLIQERLELTA